MVKKIFSALTILASVFLPFAQPLTVNAETESIRQEINILDSTLTTGTSSEQVQLDTTQYDGAGSSTQYFFEIVATSASAATATLQRVGTATNDATISFTSAATALFRAAIAAPAATTTAYDVDVSAGAPTIKAARIVIIQKANPITKTETQIEIGDSETGLSNTATSSGALANPKYWFYDSSKWNPAPTGFAEVTYAIPSVGGGSVASSADFAVPGNATWTVPTSISPATATIRLWGGGGGGGGGSGLSNSTAGGGGGAGGSFSQLNSTSVTPGAQYPLVVAASTTGSTATTGTASHGATSSFNNTVAIAVGGPGGGNGSGGAAGVATTTGSVGDTKYAGGSSSAGSTSFSGGGGGGAGTTGPGGSVTATSTAGSGTSVGGGNGGAGTASKGTAGSDGSSDGGGGGGATGKCGSITCQGGTGASGEVLILYSIAGTAATSTATIVLQKSSDLSTWTDVVDIENAQSDQAPTRDRVSFSPATGNYYRIVGMTASSSVPYNIYNAKIVLDQSNATKLEPQYLLLNSGATPTSSNQGALTTWNPGDWAGVNNTYVHQVDASSTASSTVLLKNLTAPTSTLSTITGATTTATSTISAMPIGNFNSTLDISISQNASTTYSDRILVDVVMTGPFSSHGIQIRGGGSKGKVNIRGGGVGGGKKGLVKIRAGGS